MQNSGAVQGATRAVPEGASFAQAGLPVKQEFVPFDCVLIYPLTEVVNADGVCAKVNTHELERFRTEGWIPVAELDAAAKNLKE